MISLLLNLPAILLWAITILLFVKLGWKLLRWFWRGIASTASTQPSTTV